MQISWPFPILKGSTDSHLDCPKAAFGQHDSVTIHLHRDISKPRNRGDSTVLIFGLHAEEGQPRNLPAGPSQQVGAGSLEVIEEAVEGVVMRVAKYHTSAGPGWLAVKGPLLLLAGLQLPARSLLALHLIVNVKAAASLWTLVRQPEDFPSSVEPSWRRHRKDRGGLTRRFCRQLKISYQTVTNCSECLLS